MYRSVYTLCARARTRVYMGTSMRVYANAYRNGRATVYEYIHLSAVRSGICREK